VAASHRRNRAIDYARARELRREVTGERVEAVAREEHGGPGDDVLVALALAALLLGVAVAVAAEPPRWLRHVLGRGRDAPAAAPGLRPDRHARLAGLVARRPAPARALARSRPVAAALGRRPRPGDRDRRGLEALRRRADRARLVLRALKGALRPVRSSA
jgi:hypothetical protein